MSLTSSLTPTPLPCPTDSGHTHTHTHKLLNSVTSGIPSSTYLLLACIHVPMFLLLAFLYIPLFCHPPSPYFLKDHDRVFYFPSLSLELKSNQKAFSKGCQWSKCGHRISAKRDDFCMPRALPHFKDRTPGCYVPSFPHELQIIFMWLTTALTGKYNLTGKTTIRKTLLVLACLHKKGEKSFQILLNTGFWLYAEPGAYARASSELCAVVLCMFQVAAPQLWSQRQMDSNLGWGTYWLQPWAGSSIS